MLAGGLRTLEQITDKALISQNFETMLPASAAPPAPLAGKKDPVHDYCTLEGRLPVARKGENEPMIRPLPLWRA